MKLTHRISLSLGITIFSAAILFAEQVKTDFDRNADFSEDSGEAEQHSGINPNTLGA
jgi:hypothetical protein